MVAVVSFCLNHVSVTATISNFFDVTSSEKGAVLFLIDRTFIVAIFMSLQTGPGFRLTSPARRSTIDSLSDGLEEGIGSSFRLKQTFRIGNCTEKDDENRLVVAGVFLGRYARLAFSSQTTNASSL